MPGKGKKSSLKLDLCKHSINIRNNVALSMFHQNAFPKL